MQLRIAIPLILLLLAGCSSESKKARHLERANRYFKAGEIDKAEIEYANVLRFDASQKTAVRSLGLIYFDQGKPSKAYALLNQAKQLDPDDLDVRLKLASLYLAGRKFQEARDEAEYVLGKRPGHDEAMVFLAEAAREPKQIQALRERLQAMQPQLESRPGFHLALGTLAFREKKHDEAEARFKDAVRLGPQFALAHSILGNFYVARDKRPAAEAAYKTAFELSPLRSPRRLDYIDFKVRNGDIAAGKKLLADLVQKAPDHLPAVNRLAELNFGEKNYQETAALLRKALTRDPNNFEALLTQGLLHFAQADIARAIAHFERMTATFPTVPKVRHHLALAYLATNNVVEAANQLTQAIRQDPEYADAALLLADINIRKGDSSTAIALLSELIRKQPRLADAYLALANAHRLRNELDQSLSVYGRLGEMYPQNARVPLLMGSVMLQQSKTNQARAAFEKSLQLAPNYLPALEQLIGMDLAQKQFSPALDRIQKELERSPNAPELHILLAKAYYEKGETNNVERALLRSIELDPMHREPYVLLARLYVERNEHLQAIERLKGLIARDPRDVPALMLLGMIHNQLNDFVSAREMYEKAVAVNPRFSPALNNLAYLYSERFNQLDRAFQMAQRARTLLPWDASTADTLGWILFKREEYSWALSLLQESADKLPNQPEVMYHLGMAQYMMGFENSARSSLERALQLNRDFTGRELCVRRLAILSLDTSKVDAKSLASVEEELAPQKDDPVALTKLASAYENSGAPDKARQAYERALTLSPKNVSVAIRLAKLHYKALGNRAKAMELARKARALAPDDPSIAHALGRIAFDAGQPAEMQWAHSLLQESARKLPDDPEVAFDLAWSYFGLGQVTQAETSMRKALNSTRADEARRFLKFILGEASEADIKAALEQQPAYSPALGAAAALHERKNDLPTARQMHEKTLSRFPFFVPAHKRLAIIFEANGEVAKAFEYASKARELAPDDPETAKILGIVTFKRGEFSRSAQLLRESARQKGSDAEVFFYLGLAHYRLKQVAESKDALRQALALKVTPSLAQEANRILTELN
jgi:tetratricopeptide (TPR) repeat protein